MQRFGKHIPALGAAAIAAALCSPALAQQYTSKIYRDAGGDRMVVASGGVLSIEAGGQLKFGKTDTEPTSPAEGWVYWDDSENILKVYSGAAWVALATAGGGTLDQAYDYGGAGAGKAVTVDSGAVALTNNAANNNGVLTLGKSPTGAQSGDALAITVGAQSTGTAITLANSGSGNDVTGSGSTWSVTKAGAATFSSLVATTLYQPAIAAAASGNTPLTLDAAGNGTITVGGISTGATVFAGNVDIGNAATDTLTITSIIDANVTLDDGVTDSPSLIFKDATDTTTTLKLTDNANLDLTPSSASYGLRIVTGNLRVGDGAPGTAAMDGEDFYVNGASEFDGAVQVDGAATFAGDVTATANVTLSGAEIQGATPLVFEGATDGDNFELSIAVADVGADYTITLPAGTGAVMLSTLTTNAPDAANAVTGGTNQLIFEGATGGNAHESVITATDPTADIVWTLPDAGAMTVAFMASTLATNMPDVVNSVTGGTNQLIFEGTADAFEVILTAADAAADATITLPAGGSGTVMLSSLATNAPDIVNSVTGASNAIVFEGTADEFEITLTAADAAADQTITLPAATGTVVIDTKTVSAKTEAYPVVAGDAETVFTNTGDGDGVVLTLPEASTVIGKSFRFVVLAAQNLDVNPDDADQILGLTNAAGDAIRNATAGGTVTLLAVDATNWVVVGSYGTWTDAN